MELLPGQAKQSTINKEMLLLLFDYFIFCSVSTDVLYLTNTKSIDHYKGNYDNFEKTYEELTKNKIREYEAQQQLRDHTQVGFTMTLSPT